MAKRSRGYTSKRDKTEKAVIIILAVAMLVVAIVMINQANKNADQKTVGAFAFEIGGGALNTALNFKNLGFKTSTSVKVGDDPMARAIKSKIASAGIDLDNIVETLHEKSGLSVILTSFQGDRTVLAHRGTNATLKSDEINFSAIENSKWLYLAPLNGDSTLVLDKIAKFAEEKDVNLAINLGTSSMKKCKDNLLKKRFSLLVDSPGAKV